MRLEKVASPTDIKNLEDLIFEKENIIQQYEKLYYLVGKFIM